MARRPPRLLVDGPLGPGERWIAGETHHYLTRVLRLQSGDAVTVFDGRGLEAEAQVLEVQRETTRLRTGAPLSASPGSAVPLVLLQGLAKQDRMEWIIQKTTELGVTRIVPVVTERTIARPKGQGGTRSERWRRIASEAARQCGRAEVPQVDEPAELNEALAGLNEALAGLGAHPDDLRQPADLVPTGQPGGQPWRRLVLWEESRGLPLRRALEGPPRPTTLLVGPEGGLSEAEVLKARSQGFEAVTLGPRILRTETAAVVAVALTQAAHGALD